MNGESSDRPRSVRALRCAALLLAVLLAPGCTGSDSGPPPLTAEVPLRLEQHLDAATVEGSEVPEELPDLVEWRFDEPQPDWKPVVPMNPNTESVKVERTDDALRLILDESGNNPQGNPRGGIVIDLPQGRGADWGSILVRARSNEGIQRFFAGFDTAPGAPSTTRPPRPYALTTESAPAVNDGTVHTYLLQAPQGTWNRLGLWVAANQPATFEVLSVSVLPIEADYADAPTGARQVSRVNGSRPTVYTHTPGRIGYRVVVPQGGRLDFELGVVRQGVPVTFQVQVEPDGGVPETLLKEIYADNHRWVQRSVDLSHLVGQTVTLTLGADAQRPGTVALWAIPTLRKTPTTDSGSYRVLFLGNSLYNANGGPLQGFEGFCAAEGLDCEAVNQYDRSPEIQHGIEFLGFRRIPIRLPDMARTEWIHSSIESGGFDYVVLDIRRPGWLLPDWVEDLGEFEGRPQDPYEETLAALAEIHRTIAESGAQTVLLATHGPPRALNWVQPLAKIAERFGADLEPVEIDGERHPVLVVPYGSLLLDAVNQFGAEEWFADELGHGNRLAQYAYASLIFTYVTGRDPRLNPFRDLGRLWESPEDSPVEQVSEEDAAWIKNQVWLYYTTRRR